MKLKLMAGAAAVAVLTAATGASAQVGGFYGAVDLGYHDPEGIEAESSINNVIDGRPYNWTFNSEEDWTGFARIGYRVTPNIRVELEGGYRGGDLESVRGNSTRPQPIGLCRPGVGPVTSSSVCGSPDGEIESYTLMANAIYDFLSEDSVLRPFVGVGVGFNSVRVTAFGQYSGIERGFPPQFQNLNIDDEEINFAYQGILGLAYQATERLNVDLTYRYLRGADTTFCGLNPAGPIQVGCFDGEYQDQSLTLGLRYAFGAVEAPPPPPLPPPPYVEPAPPPPPPPEPAPPPPPAPVAQEFIVYFPWDQSILTTEAQSVVQAAANYAAQGTPTSVVVVGHADTSGSAAYNVRLSERRAKAVADALVGLGVNQSSMSVDWRGETQNAVATGDGVREPLNRRTTIGINF